MLFRSPGGTIETREAAVRRGVVRPKVSEAYDDLADLAVASLAANPDDRPPDAQHLQREVEAWLEGARRRERALIDVQVARRLMQDMEADRQRLRELRRQAQALLDPLPRWAPASQKIPGWRLEDQASQLEEDAGRKEVEVLGLLGAALTRVPDLAEAHSSLATLYRGHAEDAEARRDRPAAARYRALVARHDLGEHRAWLSGVGRLTLHTEPAGALVKIGRAHV